MHGTGPERSGVQRTVTARQHRLGVNCSAKPCTITQGSRAHRQTGLAVFGRVSQQKAESSKGSKAAPGDALPRFLEASTARAAMARTVPQRTAWAGSVLNRIGWAAMARQAESRHLEPSTGSTATVSLAGRRTGIGLHRQQWNESAKEGTGAIGTGPAAMAGAAVDWPARHRHGSLASDRSEPQCYATACTGR